MTTAGPLPLAFRWRGPVLPLAPERQIACLVELQALLIRRAAPLLRCTTLLAGVELGDGRRRLLRQDRPAGFGEHELPRLLREWSDGSPGSWVARVHGLQLLGQWLGLGPRAGAGDLGLTWLPAQPPAPDLVSPAGLVLRLADLAGEGRIDVELGVAEPHLWTGPLGRLNASRLGDWCARLAAGLPLLGQRGKLDLPGPARGTVRWPVGEHWAAAELRAAPGDPRLTVRPLPDLPPPGLAALAEACLAAGDELTHLVAEVLPEGPYSLPHCSADALCWLLCGDSDESTATLASWADPAVPATPANGDHDGPIPTPPGAPAPPDREDEAARLPDAPRPQAG
ncbi:MAG: hypothetical protein RBU45_17435 [Myxococcota bacterium]|jgi:hypothetical protein|nr:hypothetical protein [Myxococcota bacterium]